MQYNKSAIQLYNIFVPLVYGKYAGKEKLLAQAAEVLLVIQLLVVTGKW